MDFLIVVVTPMCAIMLIECSKKHMWNVIEVMMGTQKQEVF
jgi:hypothetical protein